MCYYSCWRQCLDNVFLKQSSRASKWWFHVYRLTQSACVQVTSRQNHASLNNVVQEFMKHFNIKKTLVYTVLQKKKYTFGNTSISMHNYPLGVEFTFQAVILILLNYNDVRIFESKSISMDVSFCLKELALKIMK